MIKEIEEFSVKVGNEQLFDFEKINIVLSILEEKSVKVYGIEAFKIIDTMICPQMNLILDLSYVNCNDDIFKEINKYLENIVDKEGLLFSLST